MSGTGCVIFQLLRITTGLVSELSRHSVGHFAYKSMLFQNKFIILKIITAHSDTPPPPFLLIFIPLKTVQIKVENISICYATLFCNMDYF